VATYLAAEHRIDGRDAAAAGWHARARRLLAGVESAPELGWLLIEEAKRTDDPGEAERHAHAALEVAHELEPAEAPADGEPDARVETWPAGTASPCSCVAASSSPNSAPPPTRDGPALRVDVHRAEGADVDAERAVAHRAAGHRVAAGSDREGHAALARALMAAATSSASVAKATAPGRRSMAPFQPARAAS
jgi:hypothetical protein